MGNVVSASFGGGRGVCLFVLKSTQMVLRLGDNYDGEKDELQINKFNIEVSKNKTCTQLVFLKLGKNAFVLWFKSWQLQHVKN